MVARKVFFSFHYARGSWRVSVVRNSHVVRGYAKTPFYDKAEWEAIKRRRGIQPWIDEQMKGTSVTVVLVGAETARRPWVRYEIRQTLRLGKGLLGIDITKIRDRRGTTDPRGGNPIPAGYPLYRWNKDDGYHNLNAWIEAAAAG